MTQQKITYPKLAKRIAYAFVRRSEESGKIEGKKTKQKNKDEKQNCTMKTNDDDADDVDSTSVAIGVNGYC